MKLRTIARALSLPCSAALLVGCGAAAGAEADSVEASQTTCAREVIASEVVVHNALGAIHGTLEVPAGCGPFPAVVILPGSGGGDRDGNSASGRTDMYRKLARGLAEQGVASIRYDKAGVGPSAGAAPANERDFRFEMGADDAALWVPFVRSDPRVARVFVAGHSEGAHLAALVAETHPVDGVIAIAGAGRPIGDVLREQLARQGFDAETLAQIEDVLARLERGELVEPLPFTAPSLRALFRPSVQPYFVSWMARDPAEDLGALDVPVLIVQGTTDIQVKVVDAERLAAANPEAELRILDGMNHVLKAATLEPASQARAYSDPSLPVVPELFDALLPFLGGAR